MKTLYPAALVFAAVLTLGASACEKKASPSGEKTSKKSSDKTSAPAVEKTTGVTVPKVAALKVHDLASLTKAIAATEHKATLVAVWATWCAPCIAEMPTLAKFYEEHRAKGLNVIGLCVDDPNEDGMGKKIQKVLDKVKVPFTMALLKPETDEAFFTGLGIKWDSRLPSTVVFDKAGKKTLFTQDVLTEKYLADNVLPLVR